MIRLIDKTNARVGMTFNVRHVDNAYYRENLTIKSIQEDRIYINNLENYTFECNYFILVSMPERRRLSWEYAKSVFPNWPFRVWNEQYKEDDELWFNCANPDDYKCNFNDNMLSWKGDLAKLIFIDPPHPIIDETIEPWLVKEEEISHIDDHMNKKSLWWTKKISTGVVHLRDVFCSRNQLKTLFYVSESLFQPYNQESQFGPIDSRWEAVK